MLNDKNDFNQNNNIRNNGQRTLTDAFKELQESRYSQSVSVQPVNNKKTSMKKVQNKSNFKVNSVSKFERFDGIRLSNIILVIAMILLTAVALFPKNIFFQESLAKETDSQEENVETVETSSSNFEINRRALNIQKIISENSSFEKVKEQCVEERDIEFEVKSKANSSLPKGEQKILQEGVLGKQKVSLVKTFENGEFIEELILKKVVTQEPIPQILDIGTSEFLAKLNIHIGDTVYLTSDTILRKESKEDSEEVAEIKQYLDVLLLELPNEDWCKVSFDSIQGYLPTKALTSSTTTPTIVEKNRSKKLLLKVNMDMLLNQSSGLTLKDYQKIFTGLPEDKNKIFENNAEVFYNIDKKYNINGVFLASIAIHESGWGTSQIANEKKNLFGYGSYDSTPYESSFTFQDYSEGIETVAKSLVKYYLNPPGTKIYDGETASATYYNGATLSGVNTRYASDQDWHKKVYSYMEMLYNRL